MKILQKMHNVRGLFPMSYNRGVVHFKSKLLEIGKIFFILNSIYVNNI